MTRAVAAAALLAALNIASAEVGEPDGVEKPIIAGLVADPGTYLGRRVELYGLVVRTELDGRRFWLQDISQRPLLVVAPQGQRASVYDQYIVTGVLRSVGGELGIVADKLTPARVTAGGGCC